MILNLNFDDRFSISFVAQEGEKVGKTSRLLLITLLPIASAIILVTSMISYLKLYRSKRGKRFSARRNLDSDGHSLQVFSFAKIKRATNNFSSENKLGEGGYGPVYKVVSMLFRFCYIDLIILFLFFGSEFALCVFGI